MIPGFSYDQPNQKGKRVSGYQTKKSTGSILNWDVSENFNHVQKNKTKGKQITGKVNGQVFSNKQQSNTLQRMPSQHSNSQHQSSIDPQTALRIQYERIIRQNPNISQEQLDALLYDFQKRQQQKQKQSSKRIIAQQVLAPSQGSYSYDRRTPIKPNQSAKGVIYGNNQQFSNNNEKRTQSRRNNSNLVLGDGYNYFKDVRK